MWEDLIPANTTTVECLQYGCFLIMTLLLSLFRHSASTFMSTLSFGTPTYPMMEGVLLHHSQRTEESMALWQAKRLNGKDTRPVTAGWGPHAFWLPDQCFPNQTKLFLVLAAADLVVWRLYQQRVLEFSSESPAAVSNRSRLPTPFSTWLLGLSIVSKDLARVLLMYPMCPSANRKSCHMLFRIFKC